MFSNMTKIRRVTAFSSVLALALFASAAIASSASAASMGNPSVTSITPMNAGQHNDDITVTFTAPSAMVMNAYNQAMVQFEGASWVQPAPGNNQTCSGGTSVTNTSSISTHCMYQTHGGNPTVVASASSPLGAWPANTTWTFVLDHNMITFPTTTTMNVTMQTSNMSGAIDSTTYPVNLVGGTETVTFDANGGSGSMAAQSASSATTLTPNAFTRSGYTFASWNTAADGSGTSYGDGANFAFSSSVTLYAQWQSSLATTGVDQNALGATLAAGLLLLTAGATLALRRRKV